MLSVIRMQIDGQYHSTITRNLRICPFDLTTHTSALYKNGYLLDNSSRGIASHLMLVQTNLLRQVAHRKHGANQATLASTSLPYRRN